MTIQTTPTPHRPNSSIDGLEGTTFTLADAQVKRRMILSIEGDYGTGKTDLALTAPGPIAFFKMDLNSEFTIARFAKNKKIYKTEYAIPRVDDPKAQDLAESAWRVFNNDYSKAIQSPLIRTVVWDTATELWELVRLASFGRLTNIMPHHYVAVNNAFRALIKAAFDSDTNLVMVHRLKDEWMNYTAADGKEKGKRTGKKERAGFGDVGFACQVMVQTTFDPDNAESPFQMKVLKCTQNPLITHRIYGQAGDMRMNSFSVLATDVFPGTSLDDWER